VRTRGRAFIGALALFVASSVAANAFADLHAAATAMACCAKTNYDCAGMRAPDDCCEQMGHIVARTPAGTLSSATPLAVPAAIVLPAFVAAPSPASEPLTAESAFKRSHDPPHLHPYRLLI
jgi:hypothetical protein